MIIVRHWRRGITISLCAAGTVPGVGLSLLVFPPGHKENGGIFCHANSWTIVAEGILGRGYRAYEYYRGFLPSKYNDQAELHHVEPYVHCQFTHGHESPRFGQSRNPWLTGTASWSYVGVTQYILGVRAELSGLRIDPCLPEGWGLPGDAPVPGAEPDDQRGQGRRPRRRSLVRDD